MVNYFINVGMQYGAMVFTAVDNVSELSQKVLLEPISGFLISLRYIKSINKCKLRRCCSITYFKYEIRTGTGLKR